MTNTFPVELVKLDDPRLTPADYASIRLLYLETVKWCSQTQRDPSTEDIHTVFSSPLSVWRAAFTKDTHTLPALVGLIGVERINWIDRTADPSIAIVPAARRKGWSLAVAEAFRELLFKQFAIRRLQTVILEGAPSRGLLERLGFVHEGTLRSLRWVDGRYIDGLLYAWVKE